MIFTCLIVEICRGSIKKLGQDFEVELSKGLFAGKKLVLALDVIFLVVDMHILPAVMSVTTAKVAGK